MSMEDRGILLLEVKTRKGYKEAASCLEFWQSKNIRVSCWWSGLLGLVFSAKATTRFSYLELDSWKSMKGSRAGQNSL